MASSRSPCSSRASHASLVASGSVAPGGAARRSRSEAFRILSSAVDAVSGGRKTPVIGARETRLATSQRSSPEQMSAISWSIDGSSSASPAGARATQLDHANTGAHGVARGAHADAATVAGACACAMVDEGVRPLAGRLGLECRSSASA
eukprot:3375995-Prymnesium_polylepis.1